MRGNGLPHTVSFASVDEQMAAAASQHAAALIQMQQLQGTPMPAFNGQLGHPLSALPQRRSLLRSPTAPQMPGGVLLGPAQGPTRLFVHPQAYAASPHGGGVYGMPQPLYMPQPSAGAVATAAYFGAHAYAAPPPAGGGVPFAVPPAPAPAAAPVRLAAAAVAPMAAVAAAAAAVKPASPGLPSPLDRDTTIDSEIMAEALKGSPAGNPSPEYSPSLDTTVDNDILMASFTGIGSPKVSLTAAGAGE